MRELGFFGMWKGREDIGSGVEYVNRIRPPAGLGSLPSSEDLASPEAAAFWPLASFTGGQTAAQAGDR